MEIPFLRFCLDFKIATTIFAGKPGDLNPIVKMSSPPIEPMEATSTATKRPHSSITASDSAPPVKKSSKSDPIEDPPVLSFGHTLNIGYQIGGPYKCQPRLLRAVVRNELNSFFTCMYNYMHTHYYSTTRIPANPIITENHFILVCQYLLNARIHFVHQHHTSLRRDGFTRIGKDFLVPKPISDVLATYGHTTIHNGLVEVSCTRLL